MHLKQWVGVSLSNVSRLHHSITWFITIDGLCCDLAALLMACQEYLESDMQLGGEFVLTVRMAAPLRMTSVAVGGLPM